MTDDTHLSDRMPAVAAGDDWSAAERRHLAACADCRAELALWTATRELGSSVGYLPDAPAVAAVLTTRLRAARSERRSGYRRIAAAALLAAASVALAVATGTFGAATHAGRAAVTPAAGVESAFMPPELDSLSAGELRAVLDAFDEPVSGRSTVGAPGLGDLTDQELERVLRAGEV